MFGFPRKPKSAVRPQLVALPRSHQPHAVLPFDGFDLYGNQRRDLLLVVRVGRMEENPAMVAGTSASWYSLSPVAILLP